MSNSLRREIEPGEVVVIKANVFKDKNLPVAHRLFRCDSGFGLSDYTSGSAVYGCFTADPFFGWYHHESRERLEGHMIDAAATNKMSTRTILTVPVDPEHEQFKGMEGWGSFDLFDRYSVYAYHVSDDDYVVCAHIKGKVDLIPQHVDTRMKAEIFMHNLLREFDGKPQICLEFQWSQV